ncbi:hypothetical protein [Pseudomonas aeruginosa]|uniref:hypothetical protein n=1 Tax=Pseudomonas aeruginosa TaxID=287 RepID=UPI0021E788C2|nr:hypothetical protein [Pseudomonas aeruginosa]MCV3976463.1 hypothetical protein [Pseudomonas aeruginosa]
MSFIGDLAFEDQRALEDEALANPAVNDTSPDFWDGSLDSIGTGFIRGAFEAASSVEAGFNNLWISGLDAAASAFLPEPRGGGTPSVTDAETMLRDEQAKANAEYITSLRPDPETTGMAAQVTGELAAVIPRTIAGFAAGGPVGGAIAAGAPAGYAGAIEAEAQGIDPETARIKGAIDAATYGIGALMPAARFVGAAVPDFAVTVGANVGLGVASRGGTAALLEANGYTQQAQQYKALDATSMAVDAVLGAAFWGVGRIGARAPQQDIDAALAANNSGHAQDGSAPGAPVDPASSVAHQSALDLAIRQLSRNEPVDLSPIAPLVDRAEFLRGNRVGPDDAAIRSAAEQEVIPLIRQELEAEAGGRSGVINDLKVERAYLSSELSRIADTFKSRAKDFQGQRMSRKQAESAARRAIASERASLQTRITEIDRVFSENRAAERAAGEINQIDRGEIPARFMDRIASREAEIKDGYRKTALVSSVSPDRGAALMRLASEEIRKILPEQFPDQATPDAAIVRTPERDAASTVDDALANPGRGISRATPRPDEAARSGGPDSQARPKPSGRADESELEPVVSDLVQSIMAGEREITLPTGAVDADGNMVTVSARELLEQADAQVARAENDSKGIIAAALCALRFGN